jgi:hypothetical protein
MAANPVFGYADGLPVPAVPLSVTGYPDFSPGGRLSFSDTDPNPVPTEEAKQVFYLPFASPVIPIFNGTSWERRLLEGPLSNDYTDENKNPSSIPQNRCADLFVWDDDGELTLSRGNDWAYDGSERPPLEYVNQFRTNGAAITNGPDQNRGIWVGTLATWQSAPQSYLRFQKPNDQYAIIHLWNTFNKQLMVCRVEPSAGSVPGAGGWQPTNCFTWVTTGELSAAQVTGGTVSGTADFYIALTNSTMQWLLGEVQGARRAMTRLHTVAGNASTSVAFMFGPGVADFGLSIYSGAGVVISNGYIPPISTLYEG